MGPADADVSHAVRTVAVTLPHDHGAHEYLDGPDVFERDLALAEPSHKPVA